MNNVNQDYDENEASFNIQKRYGPDISSSWF